MVDQTIKEKIMKSLDEMPADASLDQIMDRIYTIHKIETGLSQARADKTISHSKVREEIEKWGK